MRVAYAILLLISLTAFADITPKIIKSARDVVNQTDYSILVDSYHNRSKLDDGKIVLSNGMPLLIYAIDQGNIELVKSIVNSGTDINLRYSNMNAIMYAFYGSTCHLDIATFLLKHGADINSVIELTGDSLTQHVVSMANYDCSHLVLSHHPNLSHTNIYGYDALISAVLGGNVKIVQELLLLGASTTYKTESGSSALAIALEIGNEEISNLLTKGK